MSYRYNVEWSIPNAGPSMNVLHFDSTQGGDLDAAVAAVRTAYKALEALIPDDVTVTFPDQVTEIDSRSGKVTDFHAVTPGLPVPGLASGVWVAGAGARVVYGTDSVVLGRRVRGATYLVPLTAAIFDGSGRVSSSNAALITGAFDAMRVALEANSSRLQVLHRPGRDNPGTGFAAEVRSVTTSPIAATLRKRKY